MYFWKYGCFSILLSFVALAFSAESRSVKATPHCEELIQKSEDAFGAGDYEKAFRLAKQALMECGDKHPVALNNMGMFYTIYGQYEKAGPLLEKAYEIRKREGPPEELKKVSNNLAALYSYTGQFHLGIPLLRKALEIAQETEGKNSVTYVLAIHNLGAALREIGAVDKAKPYLLEGVRKAPAVFGKGHPRVDIVEQELGLLYVIEEKKDSAMHLLDKTYQSLRSKLGPNNPTVVKLHFNLITAQIKFKEYQAGVDAIDSLMSSSALPAYKNSPDWPLLINNKGVALLALRKAEEAQANHERSLRLINSRPHVNLKWKNLVLLGMARSLAAQGKVEEARSRFSEMKMGQTQMISNNLMALSDYERASMLDEMKVQFDAYATFVYQHYQEYPDLLADLLDYAMFFKRAGLFSTKAVLAEARSKPSLQTKFEQWVECRKALNWQSKAQIKASDEKLDSLSRKADNLEAQLSGELSGLAFSRRSANWKLVQKGLGEGDLVVDFIHFNLLNDYTGRTDTTVYAAIIFNKEMSAPELIPLFQEHELEEFWESSRIPRIASEEFRLRYQSDDGFLYQLIMQPLEAYLNRAQTVYLSPSGALHKVSFAGLTKPGGQLVFGNKKLRYENNFQVLSSAKPVVPREIGRAALFGGIKYDKENSTAASRATNYKYLEGSLKEVNAIKKYLRKNRIKVGQWTGYEATESRFKKLKNRYDLLHFSTHGVFEENVKARQGASYAFTKDPMLKSMLIMANANHHSQGKERYKLDNDGLLTAYEIATMDLSTTRLAVLSACDTGLGTIRNFEGVFGLQRAFKIAGVRHIIMSLWEVPDQSTAEFMEAFYRHWLEGELALHDAFDKAQEEMQEKGKTPYEWAGFILL